MNFLDIAVIVVVCVSFAIVSAYLIYRKIKRKGGCECCSSCGGNCPSCRKRKDKND